MNCSEMLSSLAGHWSVSQVLRPCHAKSVMVVSCPYIESGGVSCMSGSSPVIDGVRRLCLHRQSKLQLKQRLWNNTVSKNCVILLDYCVCSLISIYVTGEVGVSMPTVCLHS